MIALSIGPITIYWYGIFYAISFLLSYYYIYTLIKKKKIKINDSKDFAEDILLYSILGVLVGGRLGYVLIYNIGYFIENPLKVFFIWEGGMAFLGAFIGVGIAIYLLAKKYKISLFKISDIILSILPFGLGLGRIGNYLNNELYGIKCNNFLQNQVGLLCKDFGDGQLRIISQALESFGEGWILLIFLQYLVWKKGALNKTGLITAIFLIWYGIFRFFIEFIRYHPSSDYLWILSKTQYFMVAFVIYGFIILNFGGNKK